eukprot:5182519-Ditylum_brightwellii.AAC.1
MSVPRKKLVIELVNEESDSKSDSTDSAVKKRPLKKAKKANSKKIQKEKVKKPVTEKAGHLSVASSQQMKQREDDKATREQQVLIMHMDHNLTERARED